MNQPLAEMFRYERWATLALVDACRTLTEEQLDAQVAGTSGSVRVLLTHIVGAQQTFVLRTKGRQHEGELHRRSPWPGIDALMEIAERTGDEMIEIAEALAEDREVDLPYMGNVHRIPASFLLVHAIEHGVEHRTEIKVALGSMGVATPDLDGWAYAAAVGIGRQV